MVGIRYLLDNLLSLGMGLLFRQSHELCLIGIMGDTIYQQIQNHSQRSVSFATNTKHSAKPEHLQDSLDLMFPNAVKVEMFARRPRNGWICLGNEVEVNGVLGQDIRVSLQDLIKQQQHTDIHTNRDANEKDPAVECVI
jgi:N6-adenosine-specific RNA methylase IME4